MLVEGEELDLSLPEPPLEKISFDLIPIPELLAVENLQRSAQVTALKRSAIPPRKFWGEASSSEKNDIEMINVIEEQIQKTEAATTNVRKETSEKIRLARTYRNAISAAYKEVVDRAKRLKSFQSDIHGYRSHLENYEKMLKHDSDKDAALRARLGDFREYTEYYHDLRENVWTDLPEPAAPDVQGTLQFLSYATMNFDHSALSIPKEVAVRNPSLPPKPEAMPEMFHFSIPKVPNIKLLVQEARMKIGNITYSLSEIDQKLEALHLKTDQKREAPHSKSGSDTILGMLKNLLSKKEDMQAETAVEDNGDETAAFSEARSNLVNQICHNYKVLFKLIGPASRRQTINSLGVRMIGTGGTSL